MTCGSPPPARPRPTWEGGVGGPEGRAGARGRRGVADGELPADAGLARSVIPPGTAATRDFSHLAPRIPELIAERCVGCMACVNACPDTAIVATVVPAPELPARIEAFAQATDDPARAAVTARSHFVDTQKYGEIP